MTCHFQPASFTADLEKTTARRTFLDSSARVSATWPAVAEPAFPRITSDVLALHRRKAAALRRATLLRYYNAGASTVRRLIGFS